MKETLPEPPRPSGGCNYDGSDIDNADEKWTTIFFTVPMIVMAIFAVGIFMAIKC